MIRGRSSRSLLRQGGRGDDHPGRAESALEAEIVHECLLHGMRFLGCAEPGNRCHTAVLDPLRRVDAGMHRFAVDDHRAGPAVAGVAALLHLEMRVIPQEGPQALPRPWFAGRSVRR